MKRTVGFSIASFCGLLLLFAVGCGNTDNMLAPTDDLTTNSIEAADGTHELIPSAGANSVEVTDGVQKAVPAAPDPPPDPCPACRPPERPA